MKISKITKVLPIVMAMSVCGVFAEEQAADYTTTAKANGNNVDAETEANNILQIQMQYKLLTQLTNFEFSQLSIAMKQ